MAIDLCGAFQYTLRMADVLKSVTVPDGLQLVAYTVNDRIYLVNMVTSDRIEFMTHQVGAKVQVTKRSYKDVAKIASDDMPYMDREETVVELGSYGYNEVPTYRMYINNWIKEQANV